MLSAKQPLATGNLADIREAIDAFIADGVPNSAVISTKRLRGGQLTGLTASWDPTAETSDEPAAQAPATG